MFDKTLLWSKKMTSLAYNRVKFIFICAVRFISSKRYHLQVFYVSAFRQHMSLMFHVSVHNDSSCVQFNELFFKFQYFYMIFSLLHMQNRKNSWKSCETNLFIVIAVKNNIYLYCRETLCYFDYVTRLRLWFLAWK